MYADCRRFNVPTIASYHCKIRAQTESGSLDMKREIVFDAIWLYLPASLLGRVSLLRTRPKTTATPITTTKYTHPLTFFGILFTYECIVFPPYAFVQRRASISLKFFHYFAGHVVATALSFFLLLFRNSICWFVHAELYLLCSFCHTHISCPLHFYYI